MGRLGPASQEPGRRGARGKASSICFVPHDAPASHGHSSLRAEPVLHWLFDYSGAGLRRPGPRDRSTSPSRAARRTAERLEISSSPAIPSRMILSRAIPVHGGEGRDHGDGGAVRAPKTNLSASGVIRPRQTDRSRQPLESGPRGRVTDWASGCARPSKAEGAQIPGLSPGMAPSRAGHGNDGRARVHQPLQAARRLRTLGVSWAIDLWGSSLGRGSEERQLTAARGVLRLRDERRMRLGERKAWTTPWI